jgi:hypothetical protein
VRTENEVCEQDQSDPKEFEKKYIRYFKGPFTFAIFAAIFSVIFFF